MNETTQRKPGRHTEGVFVRFSESQIAALKEKAAADMIPLAIYVRRAVLVHEEIGEEAPTERKTA